MAATGGLFFIPSADLLEELADRGPYASSPVLTATIRNTPSTAR